MGIEALGSIGSAFGEVMKAPLGHIVNEGPVKGGFLEGFKPMGKSDLGNLDLIGGTRQPFNPVGEILFKPQSEPAVIQQAESVAVAAWEKSELLVSEPKIIEGASYWFTDVPKKVVRPADIIMPKVESMIVPDKLVHGHTLVRSSTSTLLNPVLSPAFPALEPAIGAQSKTEVKNATHPAQAVAVQPALQEQEEEVEEMVEEKVQKEKRVLEEEEIEESNLKDVVDEEVFNRRLEEFGMAADLVGAEAEEGLEEIDGEKIVKYIPVETEVNRSGLIKKRGPDGSREETIEVVSSKKFRSVKEAKEKIAAIIAQKVPVKRAKEGKIVGYEAVARVLKYFFVKAKPAEQLVTRVIKKQRPVPVMSAVKSQIKESSIEDLGLAEVFPKAA